MLIARVFCGLICAAASTVPAASPSTNRRGDSLFHNNCSEIVTDMLAAAVTAKDQRLNRLAGTSDANADITSTRADNINTLCEYVE